MAFCELLYFLIFLFVQFLLEILHYFTQLLLKLAVESVLIFHVLEIFAVLFVLFDQSLLHSIHHFLQVFIVHIAVEHFFFDLLAVGGFLLALLNFFIVLFFGYFQFLSESVDLFLVDSFLQVPVAGEFSEFYFLFE